MENTNNVPDINDPAVQARIKENTDPTMPTYLKWLIGIGLVLIFWLAVKI